MREFRVQSGAVYFVDTNIWLYSFIKSQEDSKTSISKDIITGCDIVISTQVINELCVNLIKKVKFSEDQIQNLILSLYKRTTVMELSQEVLLAGSSIRNKHSFSFWDSLIAASALDSDADFLISEDMQNGFLLENKVRIINPFATE